VPKLGREHERGLAEAAGEDTSSRDLQGAELVPAQRECAERVERESLWSARLDYVTVAVAVGETGNGLVIASCIDQLEQRALALADGRHIPASVEGLDRLGGGVHAAGDVGGAGGSVLDRRELFGQCREVG
jgi:hypothetical protein